jgi:hypothetical protein
VVSVGGCSESTTAPRCAATCVTRKTYAFVNWSQVFSNQNIGTVSSQSAAVATIAAMITPALLLLGSASLVASALVRMARIVDRARILAAVVHDGTLDKMGVTTDRMRVWLESHAKRALCAERSIRLLYSAIVVFIATCLSIAVDRATGDILNWFPVALAVAGTVLLLAGGVYMVMESRLSGEQIADEIRNALSRLQQTKA